MNSKIIFFTIIIFIIVSCNHKVIEVENLQEKYVNMLDIEGIPQEPFNLVPFGFSDLGAWHGYALPHQDSSAYYGGFSGPLVMKSRGQWLSKNLCRLIVELDGKTLDLSKAKAEMNYYPGKLEQQLSIDNLQINISLIFISNRSSLLYSTIYNKANKHKIVEISWQGKLFNSSTTLSTIDDGLQINFDKSQEKFLIRSNNELVISLDSANKSYHMSLQKGIDLKSNESVDIALLHSYYFDVNKANREKDSISNWLQKPKKLLENNRKRWNAYVQKIFTSENKLLHKDKYRKLAVKSIMTMLTNWRSAAGDLKHDGLFPSAAFQGFYGFWSWDSWKHAVALSHFCPKLAKSSVMSMFQFQDSLGMVADCVYFDSKANNWRNTKPPLASWAVLEIFKNDGDTVFVKTLFHKLLKYHYWWYKHRDHNKNNLCEYGSTDGTLIAAKWESGMDNAVRFDNAKMLKNDDSSWSMNQESVDLNAYLYAEKIQLSLLAKIIGKDKVSIQLKKEAKSLKALIRKKFWDEASSCFYDREISSGKLLKVQQGSEIWTALYTNVATVEQADAIRHIMTNTNKFNTKLPLPTLSANNYKFNPANGYWRGPVWIDQVYFGIRALQNYQYNNLSDSIIEKSLNNAEGLLTNKSIRENYHPITGKGLNANHFSWSAAHYLLLLTE